MSPEITPLSPSAPTDEEMIRRRETLRRGLRRANFAWVVIVAVIAALVVGVVWKAGQFARETERAHGFATTAGEQAARANAEAARAEAELWKARFTEARSLRVAGGTGARVKSSRIVSDLARPADITKAQRLALRAEAIAQLALVDVDLPADWTPLRKPGYAVWDATLKRYAPVSGTNDVEIVESSSEKILTTLKVPAGFTRHDAVFSGDSRYFAGVFNPDSPRVLAWRLEDGALLLSNRTTSVSGYERPFFSPDGHHLGIYTTGALELHALDTNAPPRRFAKPVSARFSPDSKSLAVVLQTNAEIWSVETGEVQARVDLGFKPSIAAWHPDGRRLALGGKRGELALWECGIDPGTSQAGPLRRFDGHYGRVVDLFFPPDGSLLLSSAWDSVSSLWELKSGRRLLAETRANLYQFSADGALMAVEATRQLVRTAVPFLGRTGFRTVLQAGREPHPAAGIAFSRDGRHAATDHSSFTFLWDAATGRELARMAGRSPVFLPDNQSLLTCTDRGVSRFDVKATGLGAGTSNWLDGVEILHRNRAAHPNDAFNTLSLAPDDRTLVISTSEAGVVLFDLAEQRITRRLTNIIAHFAYASADGGWLVSQFHNDAAFLVSLTNATRPSYLGQHLNVGFSPVGNRLAFATSEFLTVADGNVSNRWSRIARVPLDVGRGSVASMAFTPDGRALAVTVNRFDIRLLDARNGRELATFTAPFDTPIEGGRSLEFSPDGRFLRALRQGGEVIEWDIPVVRTELAKLGLDWVEQGSKARRLAGPKAGNPEGKDSNQLARRPAGLPDAPQGAGRVNGGAWMNSLPAVGAAAAGLLAFAAGIFVFAHQRRLLSGYAQAERLAAERQQQLGQAQHALFQGQKMEALGTLAAGVAHDFNNLLSIIRMSNQLVDRTVKPEGVTKENLEAIEQAVHQGKSLINSMLGYSRRPTEAIEDFSVAKVVGDTVALLSRQFLSGLSLNLHLDPACPAIYGSRARLEQVLLNLIVNASEAMKGSGTLTVSARPVDFPAPPVHGVLQPKAASACVELSVSDTGPGIAPNVLPRIFEPFYTTKNAGAQRGTGLGLSLVYAIAKQDGWGLDVQAVTGGGTVFTILLPASQTALVGRGLPTSQDADTSSKLNVT